MSEHTSIFGSVGTISPGRAHHFLAEDDEVSSLQALIDILRKPHEVSCYHCWGRGSTMTGACCGHCGGTGKSVSTSSDY